MDTTVELEKVFRLLKKSKIKQSDVAERLGIGATYISKMIAQDKPLTDSFVSGMIREFGPYFQNDVNLRLLYESQQSKPPKLKKAEENALLFSLKAVIEELALLKSKVENEPDVAKLKKEMMKKANILSS